MKLDLAPWQKLSTSTVSDALDRLRIAGQCLGLKPLRRDFRILGQAFTVSYLPVGSGGGSVGDFVDDVPPGEVVVIDNAGRLDATVWGDLMTIVAHQRGLGGTAINGVCRDTPRSLELNYPIFTRGYTMRTGKDRVHLAAMQVPVSVGEVRIEPGDLLLGDADGLLAIPSGRAAEVLAAACEIEAAEAGIRAAILAGGRLDEARRTAGYHKLQAAQVRRTPKD